MAPPEIPGTPSAKPLPFASAGALRQKLASHTVTLGGWITLSHPAIAEIMARAGFDWVVVDLEHSVITIEQAGELIRVIDLSGSSPLVRLTSNDPNQIKRVMDAGAHGIIVPMVNSAADALRAVTATRYPPAGTRGVGLSRAQGYGPGFDEYLRWQAAGPIVIAQIEHIDAVEHLRAILAVPGIDGFIIGPYDLSCSMGIPGEFAHLAFTKALHRIREGGRAAGCPMGIHVVEPDVTQVEDAIGKGYTFVAYSVDFRMLDVSARAALATARTARP